MVTIIDNKGGTAENGVVLGYFEFAGLSTDTKPTEGIATGSIFTEVNTGKVFFFNSDAGAWVEQFSFQS